MDKPQMDRHAIPDDGEKGFERRHTSALPPGGEAFFPAPLPFAPERFSIRRRSDHLDDDDFDAVCTQLVAMTRAVNKLISLASPPVEGVSLNYAPVTNDEAAALYIKFTSLTGGLENRLRAVVDSFLEARNVNASR